MKPITASVVMTTSNATCWSKNICQNESPVYTARCGRGP